MLAGRLISLLTSDADRVVTGGHVYNRHMVEEAAHHAALVEVVQVNRPFDPRTVQGQVVIDSLVAWEVALGLPGAGLPPLTALVHQVAGGVSGPRALRSARRLADLALYRRCDLVIAASTFLCQELVSAGIPKDRIRIVPPGRNLLGEEAVDSPHDLRRGKRLAMLNVANWVPNKGILDLLDAVEPMSSDEVVLHLVGSPDMNRRYARRIRARLTDATLRDKVVVHGAVPNVQMGRFYEGSDVVVSTSREEGYGSVIAEALARGVPVIAWGSGNVPNLFRDQEEGFLLATGDVIGVTDAVRRLARDEELRSSLSTAAARRGSDLPTWQQSGRLFFKALKEAARPSHAQSTGLGTAF